MDFLEKNWTLISSQPLPFILLTFIVGGFMWGVAAKYYAGQLATAKGETTLAEKQRDDFKSKLSVSSPDEAKAKVDRLEGELTGLNRIISVTIGYPWKPLTDQQVTDLSARLALLQRHRVQIMYANQLGKDLAQSLYRAFQKAEWQGATFSDGGGAHLGIIAGAGTGMASALKQAIETTTPLRIELDKPTTPEIDGQVYLFVGTNSVNLP